MHSIDYTPPNATAATPGLGGHALPVSGNSNTALPLNVLFAGKQSVPAERQLDALFKQYITRRQHFYGVELAARSYGRAGLLDYNSFGAVLPLFTSLVWLGQEYWNVDPMAEVESVRFAERLQEHTLVLPHFTCYRANCARLTALMALNFSNVLALRGDLVDPKQDYQHTSEMIEDIRKLRGDTISIGVGGYPGGHPEGESLTADMSHLQEKIEAGGDFIITQLSFSTADIKEFVKACRDRGIEVPIIIGIFVPETMQALTQILRITRVPMAPEQLAEFEAVKHKAHKFQDLSVQKGVQMITELFDSDLQIYGIHFFSMNRFTVIHRILAEITPKYFEKSETTIDDSELQAI